MTVIYALVLQHVNDDRLIPQPVLHAAYKAFASAPPPHPMSPRMLKQK